MNLGTTFQLAVALVSALVAAVLFYVFVRPVEAHVSMGVIASKTFEHGRKMQKLYAGPRRELWATVDRKLPPSYLFTIRLEQPLGDVSYLLEATAGERFAVGQRVTVTYDERGIPPFWQKRYVRQIAPVEVR